MNVFHQTETHAKYTKGAQHAVHRNRHNTMAPTAMCTWRLKSTARGFAPFISPPPPPRAGDLLALEAMSLSRRTHAKVAAGLSWRWRKMRQPSTAHADHCA